MNKNGILVSFFVLFSLSCSLFAQDKNFTKHTVLKGENIKQIATKYKVTPFDIYKLNPDSRGGIVENDILIIPVQKVEQVTPPAETVLSKPKNTYSNVKTHIAKPKETFYSISRDYNVDVEDLKNLNQEILKEGLKVGKAIVIPTAKKTAKKEPSVSIVNSTKEFEIKEKVAEIIKHKVEPKETLYGLSKKYNVSVDEIKQKNEAVLQNGLQIGQILIIRKIN